MSKYSELLSWRDSQARREGVENYLVLSNSALAEIAEKMPRTLDQLLEIKGIKDKKLAKYGKKILEIINPQTSDRAVDEIVSQTEADKVFSVSVFLDLVNTGLRTFKVKIRGEVSSVAERGGHYYFDLKDKEDGSVISCLIWNRNFRFCGVNLTEGMEILASGFPSIYKPSGRISFQAETIELLGEGALKKQFEELKDKLAKEGLFSQERKKAIPLFPEKIGLITSRQGEAIHDFLTNLGRFGLKIKFIDSRVEGVQAVPTLIKAIRRFKKEDIDVLVLVRGGGSLESLLSFNNESLVREIAGFGKPVISGIGHEQDVSLVDLVADRSCSTPTGAAKLVSYSWEQARAKVDISARQIFSNFSNQLHAQVILSERMAECIKKEFRHIFDDFRGNSFKLRKELSKLKTWIREAPDKISRSFSSMSSGLSKALYSETQQIAQMERTLTLSDPERQLKLGYSLVYTGGHLIRSVSDVSKEEEIKIQLRDGKIVTEVKHIEKNGKQN